MSRAPKTSLNELRDLAALRLRLRVALKDVIPTLRWFAEQQKLGGMPANIWKNLDRLPAPKMHGLSPAFDLMHALQRLERTVRQYDEDSSQEVFVCLTALNDKLKDVVAAEGASSDESGDELLMRLLSDDRTGTLTLESAARVLRCGCFPVRIPALPSYIAGHVVFSELRLIRAQFERFGMSATVKRAPSAAFVAQGVAAVLAFGSMVRKRAETCAAIARDLKQVLELETITGGHTTDGSAREAVERARQAQERFLFSRLAQNFRRAGVSILGYRKMFEAAAEWATTKSQLPGSHESPAETSQADASQGANDDSGTLNWRAELQHLFDRAGAAETVDAHEAGYKRAGEFVERYQQCLDEIVLSIDMKVEGSGVASLHALDRIESMHASGGGAWAPTIMYTARVRILRECDESLALFGFDPATTCTDVLDAARRQLLRALSASWHLHRRAFADGITIPTDKAVLLALRNFVADETVRSEQQHSDGVPARSPEEEQGHSARLRELATALRRELGADDSAGAIEPWIKARSHVFDVAKQLAVELGEATNGPAEIACAFEKASDGYVARVDAIEAKLFEETRWAPNFAERLLFGSLTAAADRSDPLDLLSALWICDRTGKAWPENLEERTAAAVGNLQRPDGGFESGRPPVKWVHGFVMLPPSAATIGVLANFLRKAPHGASQRVTDEVYERRLMRWEPICTRSVEYLLNSRVGRYRKGKELSGWHSDRQPEDERIDLFTTCVATRALCEMDEVLSHLINRRAFEGLDVEHPAQESPEKLFVFDCLSLNPAADEHAVLVSAQRASEWLRYHARGFVRPGQLPQGYKPVTTTLYYGPPGTGKTFASKHIAGELHWPLVTVNPHHFLREGDEFVGKVASEIFTRLQFASNCCICFDEFDQLIIDRNIQKVPSQFAMVTTTMLPLLASLHDHAERNNCLIAFATNYHAFLDAAATRRGRIDQQSCVVHPDYGSRYLYLLMMASKPPKDFRAQQDASPKEIDRLANATAMRTVGDLKKVAKEHLVDDPSRLSLPLPALGPGHYRDMLNRLIALKPPDADASSRAEAIAGSRIEIDRLLKSLGPELVFSEAWFKSLSLREPRQWMDVIHLVHDAAAVPGTDDTPSKNG